MTQSRNIIREFGGVLIDSEPVLKVTNEFPVTFGNGTPSVSPDTGAVTVGGGLGVEGDIFVAGSIVALGGIDMVNQRIGNLGVPVQDHDAVNLKYFNSHSGGLVAGIGIDKDVNTISVSPSQPHITSLGTIRNGTWMGSPIEVPYGGLGSTVLPAGQLLFGSGTDPVRTDPGLTYNSITKTLALGGLNDAYDVGTGALTVAGGISVNKSMFLQGTMSIQGRQINMGVVDIRNATEVGQGPNGEGALNVAGGATVGGSVSIQGRLEAVGGVIVDTLRCRSTADAESISTGSAVYMGGIGVAGKIYVGSDANITGLLYVQSSDETAFNVAGGGHIGKSLSVVGNISSEGLLTVTGSIVSKAALQGVSLHTSSTTDDSISTDGGLTVATSVRIGADAFITGTLTLRDMRADTSSVGSLIADSFTCNRESSFLGVTRFEQPVSFVSDVSFAGDITASKTIRAQGSITASEALVSESTTDASSFNPLADEASIRSVGGICIAKSGYFGDSISVKEGIRCFGTADSPLPNLGAITCSGGVGIEKGISVGGLATFLSVMDVTGDVLAHGVVHIDAETDIVANDLRSGGLIVDGGASFRRSVQIGENINISGTTTLLGTLTASRATFSGKFISSSQLDATALDSASGLFAGGIAVSKTALVGGDLRVFGKTYMDGGVAFGGETIFPDVLRATSPEDATDVSSGAFIVEGGVGIGKSLFVGGLGMFSTSLQVAGTLRVTSTAQASDTSTGSVQLDGGASIKRSLVVGERATFLGKVHNASDVTVSGSFSIAGPSRMSGELAATGICRLGLEADGYTESLQVSSGRVTVSAATTMTHLSTLDSTDPASGSLTLLGGLGIAKSASIGGSVIVQGTSTFVRETTVQAGLHVTGAFTTDGDVRTQGSLTIARDLLLTTGQANLSKLLVTDPSDVNGPIGASARFAGGINVGKTMIVGGESRLQGTLRAEGGSVLSGLTTLQGTLVATDPTNSTSINSAAIVIHGGLSVAKATTLSSLLVLNDVAFSGQQATFSGAAVVQGQLTASGVSEATGSGTGAISAVGGISTAKSIFAGGNLTVSGDTRLMGSVSMANYTISNQTVTGTTDSSTPLNGSLTTSGGMGVAKSLNVGLGISGSTLKVNSSLDASAVNSAAAVIAGGLSVGRTAYFAGNTQTYGLASFGAAVTMNSTLSAIGSVTIGSTDSSGNDSGNLVCLGGAGIAKALTVGGPVTLSASIVGTSTADATSLASPSGSALQLSGGAVIAKSLLVGANLAVAAAFTCAGPVSVSSSVTIGGTLSVASPSESSMQTAGGLNVAKSGVIGQRLSVGGRIAATSMSLSGTADSNPDDLTSGALVCAGGISAARSISSDANIYANGNIRATGRILVTGDTEATSALSPNPGVMATASIATLGGAAIGRSLFIGNLLNVSGPGVFRSTITVLSTTNSSDPSQGAATFQGGIGVARNVSIGENLYVTGRSELRGGLLITSLSATGPVVFSDTTEATSHDLAGALFQGGVSIAKSLKVGANVSANTANIATTLTSATIIASRVDLAQATQTDSIVTGGGVLVGKDLVVTGGTTVNNGALFHGPLTASGPAIFSSTVRFTNNNPSQTPQSGSVVLDGGIGIGGDVYAQGNISSADGTFGGKVDILGGTTVGGPVLLRSDEEAQDLSRAALVAVGGAAFGKSVRVGGSLNVAGSAVCSGQSTALSLSLTGTGDNGLGSGVLNVGGGASIMKSMYVVGALNALSSLTATGPAVFLGSVSIAKPLAITDGTDLTSFVTAGGATFAKSCRVNGTFTATARSLLQSVSISQDLAIAGPLSVSSTADDSVRVAGGLSVGRSIRVDRSLNVGQTLSVGSGTDTFSPPLSVTSGSFLHVASSTLTDTATAASTVREGNYFNYFGVPTLVVNSSDVRLTNVATVFIAGAPVPTNTTFSHSAALWIGSGQLRVSDDRESQGVGSGCSLFAGGVSIGRSLNVGSNLSVGGNLTSTGAVTVNGLVTLTAASAATLCMTVAGKVSIEGGLALGGDGFSLTGGARTISATSLALDSPTDSTVDGEGALVLAGGAFFSKSLGLGGHVRAAGNATFEGMMQTATLRVTDGTASAAFIAGGLSCATAAVTGALSAETGTVRGSFSLGGILRISSTTESTTAEDGSIVTDGGIASKKSIYAGLNLSVGAASRFYGSASFNAATTFESGATLRSLQSDEATSLDSASAVFEGGVAVKKSVRIGGDVRSVGRMVADGPFSSKGSFSQANVELLPLSPGVTVSISANVPGVILISGAPTTDGVVITFPSAGLLSDGQTIFVSTTQAMTGIVVGTPGATFAPNMAFPHTLAAGQVLKYMYVARMTMWYKIA